MSDINAAYLYAQFQMIDEIVEHRKILWRTYEKYLHQQNPEGNHHIYYILCRSPPRLQEFLSAHHIMTTTHYIPLHQSAFYRSTFGGLCLPRADFFHHHLLRLPLYHNLTQAQVKMICGYILESNELLP
jgi:dTDP-4-amino-4,6-dideoxygalactose transaminase